MIDKETFEHAGGERVGLTDGVRLAEAAEKVNFADEWGFGMGGKESDDVVLPHLCVGSEDGRDH